MALLMTVTGRWRRVAIAALMVAATLSPTSAAAQEKVAVTLAAVAIFADDPFPGTHFAEPLVSGSIQRIFLRFLVLDGDLTFWQHAYRRDVGPHNISSPTGVIGHVENTVVIDDRKTWTAGVNVLVRSTGAVRAFGGVGAGFLTQDTVYSTTPTGCTSTTRPEICAPFVSARVRGPLANIRVLGGVEVPVGRRLAIVGTVKGDTRPGRPRPYRGGCRRGSVFAVMIHS
jgi:hypothetical protein